MDVFIWINVLGSLNMNIFVHKLAFGQGKNVSFIRVEMLGFYPPVVSPEPRTVPDIYIGT